MSRPCAGMFIKKPLHLCCSCSSQCVKQDFGLAAFEVNWEALVDTCRHGTITGGCNCGVQGCCSCLLLLAVAEKTHPHLWYTWLVDIQSSARAHHGGTAVGQAVPTGDPP